MKSNLKFFDFDTGAPSNCGHVLDIEFSSVDLDWPGVVLEKGSSPFFYPKNVYTPYFYFALALEGELHWSIETSSGVTELKTALATFGSTRQEPRFHMTFLNRAISLSWR